MISIELKDNLSKLIFVAIIHIKYINILSKT